MMTNVFITSLYCGNTASNCKNSALLIRRALAKECLGRAAGCPAEIGNEMRLVEVTCSVRHCREIRASLPQSHRTL
jgi:hypothetical protein